MNVILLKKQTFVPVGWALLIALITTLAITSLIIALMFICVMVNDCEIEFKTVIITIVLIICGVVFGVKSYNLYKIKSMPSIKLVIDKSVPYSYIDENYEILKCDYPYFIVKDNGMMDEQ